MELVQLNSISAIVHDEAEEGQPMVIDFLILFVQITNKHAAHSCCSSQDMQEKLFLTVPRFKKYRLFPFKHPMKELHLDKMFDLCDKYIPCIIRPNTFDHEICACFVNEKKTSIGKSDKLRTALHGYVQKSIQGGLIGITEMKIEVAKHDRLL